MHGTTNKKKNKKKTMLRTSLQQHALKDFTGALLGLNIDFELKRSHMQHTDLVH